MGSKHSEDDPAAAVLTSIMVISALEVYEEAAPGTSHPTRCTLELESHPNHCTHTIGCLQHKALERQRDTSAKHLAFSKRALPEERLAEVERLGAAASRVVVQMARANAEGEAERVAKAEAEVQSSG